MALSGSFIGTAVIAITFVAIVNAVIKQVRATSRPQHYPPGPPTFPGLGNALQIPPALMFLKFEEWSKTYGSILGLKMGSLNFVVLHDPQHVHELFSKRGAIYSDRHLPSAMAQNLLKEHSHRHVLNIGPGPYLKRWRMAATSLFGPTGQKQTFPMQEATSAALVERLLNSTPEESQRHLRDWTLATPLLATTGQRIEHRGGDWVDQYFHTQDELLKIIEPGKAPPVDVFPFLQHVPETFAKWKATARQLRKAILDDAHSFVETAKSLCSTSATKSPDEFRCVMTKVIEEEAREDFRGMQFNDDDLAWFGWVLVGAAIDTTWATITSSVLYMASHPEVQEKAFAQVANVSDDKPPRVDAVDQFSYVRAIMLEVLRMRPPVPGGVPHTLEQDDTFHGYTIPKGTTILPNIWSLQHNPDDYEAPYQFRPERFVEHPMGLKASAKNLEGRRISHAFGEGRRICPGESFAQNSLILAIAKLLWAYEIIPLEKLDLSIETGYLHGIILLPKPFKVEFRLRDEAKRASVIQDHERAIAALREIGL